MGTFIKDIFRTKQIRDLQETEAKHGLKRALGPLHLVFLGIGCTIGAGIFVLTGTVAAQNAGPGIMLSFVLAGFAALFAALCYSEFASLVPISGSAYTYSYTTLGEIIAWIIGWDLVLEYAIGAMAVSIGWSGYVTEFLKNFGLAIPPQLAAAHGSLVTLANGQQVEAWFNLPAVFIVFAITVLLIIGIRESASLNNLIVLIKIGVILLFVFGSMHAIKVGNWHPFIPQNNGEWGHFGWTGIMMGAGIVFFAYVGFDAVSTAAQEARNPRRDMPIGLIGSLLVCTVLYIAVAAVATGVVSYKDLDVPHPIAVAASHAGLPWMSFAVEFGAIAGLSSVILVLLLGQSRIIWTMAHDGLLPPFFSHVHPKLKTPWISSVILGLLVSIFSAFFTIREAGSLVSIGTLLAFIIVCSSVLILRIREPQHERPFRTPCIWLVAPVGALASLVLMLSLPGLTWIRLVVWLVIGQVIYFAYGRKHSVLAGR
ncbi:MAG: amino acid permease [Verrucomicrobiales bacterium]|nr:amino acid permease [Verrucomicrobiales bacterium]